MDTFLTGIMLFLMLLASFNLFVGVSNDAVNFLSSALGSRAASFNRVMFVAAAGVLLGCTFSSGMMEIARSGIFNPTMFTFYDVMIVFFAVMMTDVLLLDTFNSLGLPTSTTVSIVFELLGGSVITASYKLWITTGSLGGLGAYINNEKALSIIIGILSSVIIASISLLFSLSIRHFPCKYGIHAMLVRNPAAVTVKNHFPALLNHPILIAGEQFPRCPVPGTQVRVRRLRDKGLFHKNIDRMHAA